MFARKNKRAAAPKGRGAAAAKQMGLFLDFKPEDMMNMEQDLDDPSLEAEFAAIVGKKPNAPTRDKKPPKAPLPMEDIEKMAEACMKDIDDDGDESLENDEDLLAELQEVVGEAESEDLGGSTPFSHISAETPEAQLMPTSQEPKVSSVAGSMEYTLEERINLYRMAITNANATGETSKARRYERGLKTLQTMLSSVRKGVKIAESEIPPPVACGGSSRPPAPAMAPDQQIEYDSAVETSPVSPEEALVVISSTSGSRDESSGVTSPASLSSPEGELLEQKAAENLQDSPVQQLSKEALLAQQREYRMAALEAKQAGNIDQAKMHVKASKGYDAAIEALEKGQPVDVGSLPPPLSQAESPSQPTTVLKALEQRMTKYKEAFTQAKASGDERKARMHDRIAKQYQSAIRFPPIPGQKAASPEQGFAAVLETANKLTSNEVEAADAEDEDEVEEEKAPKLDQKKPTLEVQPTLQEPDNRSPSHSPERMSKRGSLPDSAQQQLDLLEGRKKQFMKAALQAKQKKDLEQAKSFLRTAKSLDSFIEVIRSGKTVDLTKVPSPPGEEEENFIVVHHSDVQVSEKSEEIFSQLTKLLKEQFEKCTTYSKQFTHMGNVAETTKFETMAERCKKSIEIVKRAQSRGLQPPKHHFEERTYRTVRIFPELSSTDLIVLIDRGMNLPAPSGVATNDLDAYVKFDFPYPSSEQPQRHKTPVVKNTNNPEFNQSFKLNINRNHRGFRRVIQSKGLKLEVLHKGGFLRSDKPLGTALLKLEKLETQSEVRQIVELLDGRKATGGRLEVRVRLREPLSGQELQMITERWLVLDEPQVLL
ncbi:hypothetical protein DNTS_017265 [Danionella cerebrum]|uniref:Coiled-coil and C2 domain-containing protein 1B n=1 Tax=Danionella cerebrum TaxID=2873325 RepID=A0A553RF26_9TELE|nr:hypothetical protein DNTS_017265 [Danionella translucida]TRZ00795.1 hypothetical protein DNTS_017265 [Danionella translucida]